MTTHAYGPDNPHPFSTIRTELIWEGKYDEYGNRREVDVAGAAMPLQKIETVDEPRSRALVQGSLFDPQTAHRDDFRNMLIWGDNKLVMASLLKEYKGKIDLIYIDPPFNVGGVFATIREEFGRFNRSQLCERVNHIRAFRNKYIAHQEEDTDLNDVEFARVELKNWITGLSAIHKATVD